MVSVFSTTATCWQGEWFRLTQVQNISASSSLAAVFEVRLRAILISFFFLLQNGQSEVCSLMSAQCVGAITLWKNANTFLSALNLLLWVLSSQRSKTCRSGELYTGLKVWVHMRIVMNLTTAFRVTRLFSDTSVPMKYNLKPAGMFGIIVYCL